MSASISAGHLFPVPRVVHGGAGLSADRHRDLIAQAVNEVASAAFSPEVAGDSSSATQDTTASWVVYSGLSITVVPPVPSSVVIAGSLDVRAKTWVAGNGNFEAQLKIGSTVLSSAEWDPRAADLRSPIVLLGFATNLEPATSYSLTVEVKTSSSGTNVYEINTGASTERCSMVAALLPRLLQ